MAYESLRTDLRFVVLLRFSNLQIPKAYFFVPKIPDLDSVQRDYPGINRRGNYVRGVLHRVQYFCLGMRERVRNRRWLMKRKLTHEEQVEELHQELFLQFIEWDKLRKHGGQDPFYGDGTNMNLTRNHIISIKQDLLQLCEHDELPKIYYRETPPEVDDNYLAPNGKYFEERKKNIEEMGDKITTVIPEDREKKTMSLFEAGGSYDPN